MGLFVQTSILTNGKIYNTCIRDNVQTMCPPPNLPNCILDPFRAVLSTPPWLVKLCRNIWRWVWRWAANGSVRTDIYLDKWENIQQWDLR